MWPNKSTLVRTRRVQKHGPVFASNLYGTNMVVVADFAGFEKVLGGDHKISECAVDPLAYTRMCMHMSVL